MKKINDWVIRTFGLRGSWSWAKKQMLNGAIIKRKATIGTYLKMENHVSGLKMIMTRNVIIMSSRNALRYTDSFVDALRL